MPDNPISSIAFVGLGAMGAPMAENLVRKQFRVTGFDMRAEARAALAAAGGHEAASAKEAAQGADALVLMVVNAAQARSVLFDAGALDALAPGATVILMATCPPGEAEAIAAQVTKTGRHFIDAPVSGGINGARNATLTIMVGAPGESFARAKPVLDALGDKVFHVGEKLLCGVHIAVAAEALSLAEKAGIDGSLLFEIMGGSAASSWMLKDRGPRMQEPDPVVASAVDIFVKDLGIVLDAGRAAKTALPLAAAAHQMFLAASGLGHGGRDDSQVVRAYRALNAKPANDA
jgi:3-hydroxyisobutyrate dehydrogenase